MKNGASLRPYEISKNLIKGRLIIRNTYNKTYWHGTYGVYVDLECD